MGTVATLEKRNNNITALSITDIVVSENPVVIYAHTNTNDGLYYLSCLHQIKLDVIDQNVIETTLGLYIVPSADLESREAERVAIISITKDSKINLENIGLLINAQQSLIIKLLPEETRLLMDYPKGSNRVKISISINGEIDVFNE